MTPIRAYLKTPCEGLGKLHRILILGFTTDIDTGEVKAVCLSDTKERTIILSLNRLGIYKYDWYTLRQDM